MNGHLIHILGEGLQSRSCRLSRRPSSDRSCSRAGCCSARWGWGLARRAQVRSLRTFEFATTTSSASPLAPALGPSSRTTSTPSTSSTSPFSSSGTHRASSAPLATFSGRPWTHFHFISFPRGRGFVLWAISTVIIILRLALPPLLLSQAFNYLLTPLARTLPAFSAPAT